MKVVYKVGWVLIGVLLFGIFSCGDSPGDELDCRDEKFDRYTVGFNLSVKVLNADGTPHIGKVQYLINKEYCDGVEKGLYTAEGTTNSNGYWNPSYIMSYDFTNMDDIVEVEWKVDGLESFNDIYSEDEVYGENTITKTYEYTLK